MKSKKRDKRTKRERNLCGLESEVEFRKVIVIFGLISLMLTLLAYGAGVSLANNFHPTAAVIEDRSAQSTLNGGLSEKDAADASSQEVLDLFQGKYKKEIEKVLEEEAADKKETVDIYITELQALVTNKSDNITDEEARRALFGAEQDVAEMVAHGRLPTGFVNLTLEESRDAYAGENVDDLLRKIEQLKQLKRGDEAKKLYEATKAAIEGKEKFGIDYLKVVQNAIKIRQWKERSYGLYNMMGILEQRMEAVRKIEGLNYTMAEELYNKTLDAFYGDRFDDVDKLFVQTDKTIDELMLRSSQVKALWSIYKRTFSYFLIKNWWKILIILAIGIPLGLIVFNKLMLKRAIIKKRDMEIESKVVVNLIKRLQEDYLVKRSIAKSVYDVRVSKYTERKMYLKRNIPVIQAEIERRRKKLIVLK